jgi:hypothetical protein
MHEIVPWESAIIFKIQGDTVVNILDKDKKIICVLDISTVPTAHFILIKNGYPQDKNSLCGSSTEKNIKDFIMTFSDKQISLFAIQSNGDYLLLTALNHSKTIQNAKYYQTEKWFVEKEINIDNEEDFEKETGFKNMKNLNFKTANGFYFTNIDGNDISGATIVAISIAVFIVLAVVIGLPLLFAYSPLSGWKYNKNRGTFLY